MRRRHTSTRGHVGAELQHAVRVFAEWIAPTLPHPGVESVAVNFVAGPFVSILDRARDAFRGHAA